MNMSHLSIVPGMLRAPFGSFLAGHLRDDEDTDQGENAWYAEANDLGPGTVDEYPQDYWQDNGHYDRTDHATTGECLPG
jgi:hypothetical protein